MNYQEILSKYYPCENELKRILWVHSRHVADKALAIARRHPELPLDCDFLEEAAMLHDIGIFRCHAPAIFCQGDAPYILHGTIGAELLRADGWPRHAGVCEHHTGAGLTARQIIERQLPLPPRDLLPVTEEETLICYADKFFSKTRPDTEKTFDQAVRSLSKFGEEGLQRFYEWHKRYE